MPSTRLPVAAAIAVSVAVAATLSTSERTADAQTIIKNVSDHPDYKVELEPHLDFGWTTRYYASNGFGAGVRATIPIIHNGFIPNLNNSVGIGFGLEWLRYSGCYGAFNGSADCGGASYFLFPVVMQWNFWLTSHWSVFGEPGLYFYHGVFDDYCSVLQKTNKNVVCSYPTKNGIDFAAFAGGRFHFNDNIALTLRVGYPMISAGLSILF